MSKDARVLIRLDSEEFIAQITRKLSGSCKELTVTSNNDQVKAYSTSGDYDVTILCSKKTSVEDEQIVADLKNKPESSRGAIFVVSATADDQELLRIKKRGGIRCFKIKEFNLKELLWVLVPLMPDAAGPGVYDVRVINSFVGSVRKVFEAYLGDAPTFSKPEVKSNNKATGSYTTLMSFNGPNAQGSIALCFEKQFLVKLSRILFAGLTVPVTDDSLIDLAGEMGNQVCGSFKLDIAELGLNVMISLPKVISGSGHTITHIVNNPVITVTAIHENNKLDVEFCMSKTQDQVLENTNRNDDLKSGEVALF